MTLLKYASCLVQQKTELIVTDVEDVVNLDKVTQKSQEALNRAGRIAEEASHPALEPEHLLLALLEQNDGVIPNILEKLNVRVQSVRDAIVTAGKKFPTVTGEARLTASHNFTEVIKKAEAEAKSLGDSYISTEHFLLAFFDLKIQIHHKK